MCHKIQRKVEGSDAENRTDRETAKHAKMGIGAWCPIERDHLPRNSSCFFGSHRKGLNGSPDLPLRVGDGLARLCRDNLGKLVTAPINQGGDLLEDIVSGMRRKALHSHSRKTRGCYGLFDIRFSRLSDLGDEFSGERINDRDREIARLPLAMNEKRSGFLHWKTHRSLDEVGTSPPLQPVQRFQQQIEQPWLSLARRRP